MEEQTTYITPSGPRDRELRVSNDEREAVATILRREHVAGRLDSGEFDERLGRCLTARTYAELDQLISDFPLTEAERGPSRQVAWRLRSWLLMVLPLIALAIGFSHGRAAWLLVPFFFWFVVRPFLWGYGWRAAAWRGAGGRDSRRRF
jgi:hypothetical protein